MTSAADPLNILLLYFPIWFFVSQKVGTRMLWVAVIGDWSNLILKWILSGQRPYWWVHETEFYQSHSVPKLEQFSITCETGPGSPSGHAMGSSSVCYVMVTAVLTYTKRRGGCFHWLSWIVLWSIFCVIQLCVCMSRVFLATHFPHQVILGIIGGVFVADAFNRLQWIHTANQKQYNFIVAFLLLFTLGFYELLKLINVDLDWSVEKANKWCANPEWIHFDTTPFAGLYRNLGALIGLGIAINSRMFLQAHTQRNNGTIGFKLLCITCCLVLLHLFDCIPVPSHSIYLFYMFSFCKSAAIPLTVVGLVPYCMQLLLCGNKKAHT